MLQLPQPLQTTGEETMKLVIIIDVESGGGHGEADAIEEGIRGYLEAYQGAPVIVKSITTGAES